MSKCVVRNLREKFGKRKNALPMGLEFLEGISYYAIAVHETNDKKKQTRIEFLPRALRSIVEKAMERDELVEQLEALKGTIDELKSALNTEKTKHGLTAKNLIQRSINLKDGVAVEDTSPKNYWNVAEKKGFIPNGTKVSGGLPSLPKKR